MNKLQETLDEFHSLYGWRLQDDIQQETREYLCNKIVEYARSKVPKERETTFSSYDLIINAENRVIKEIDNSVQQDLQSLND